MCISADDQERLLDPSKWPDSISISEWFFKASEHATRGKRLKLAGQDDEATAADGAVGGRHIPVSDTSVMELDGSEDTIPLDTTMINAHVNDDDV